MTLIFEHFWGKIIGICLGMSFYVYLVASKWIKRIVKSVTGYFENCKQDNNLISLLLLKFVNIYICIDMLNIIDGYGPASSG